MPTRSKRKIVHQVNSAANSSTAICNARTARLYFNTVITACVDGVEIRLSSGLRIDVDAVPKHSRLCRRCTSERWRRHHTEAILLEIHRTIEIEEIGERGLVLFEDAIFEHHHIFGIGRIFELVCHNAHFAQDRQRIRLCVASNNDAKASQNESTYLSHNSRAFYPKAQMCLLCFWQVSWLV